MKTVAIDKFQSDSAKYMRIARKEKVVITRNGKPTAMLIGFESEEDWIDYCIENDPRFLKSVASARKSLREGKGKRLEDIK